MKKTTKLTEYINKGLMPTTLLERVKEVQRSYNMLRTVLICADEEKVLAMSGSVLNTTDVQFQQVESVLDYSEWRDDEAGLLPSEYDHSRFMRSTRLAVLRMKVSEHKQYAFVAKAADESGEVHVVKYSFERLNAEASYILCIRQEITQSLEHDILTGGLNREGLLRELAQKFAQRQSGIEYALLNFNIKGFKTVNERYGSLVGDRVLQYMYTQLVYSELHPVSYARFEADNFVCLIRNEQLDKDLVSRMCQQECVVDGQKIAFRCVCGIYMLSDEPVTPFMACAHAKLAASCIKDQFITPYKVFDPAMTQSVMSDSVVLGQLDQALCNNEFVPYFQPVVDLQTGRVAMGEALVRWKSPKHGMISPAVFIPILEKNGGLSCIDQLMEERVFNLQRQRLADGLPVVPIDMNLSWTDFADTKFLDQMKAHVLDPSLPTDLMRYEITESAIDEIADNRRDMLEFFQQNNVKLLVDDFGSGYSFGTMKSIEFHIVKLDKSLIDKLGQSRKMDILVETLITVFHKMNAKVVAEGVETERQMLYLKQIGCDYVQGFYFYRPMPESEFLALLDKQHAEEQKTAEDSTSVTQLQTSDVNSNQVWVERDVLEKQYAKLEQSDEESKCLHMLLDELDIFCFVWDVKTHVDTAPDKFCQMYGLKSNQLPNMPEQCDLCHPEDRDRFRLLYARAARGERMGSDYFRLLAPDGKTYVWYRKTFYTLFDRNNVPYKAIMTLQDCTDKFRYRVLHSRDLLLTKQQECPTFIYTLADDTMSFNFLAPNGEVMSMSIPNYLHPTEGQKTADQDQLAAMIRERLEKNQRQGHIDFYDHRLKADLRAHFMIVDGEYGHPYALVGQAEDINKTREQLAAKDRIIRISELDGLTQIYNRSKGESEIEKALAKGEPGMFGILDCDKFKLVNDTFGHHVGDQLLVEVAKCIAQISSLGISMRLGGDEFAFFVVGEFSDALKTQRLNEFFAQIDQINIPEMQGMSVQVSVGVVTYSGKDQVTFDTLYRAADHLLYQSKKVEGNSCTYGNI